MKYIVTVRCIRTKTEETYVDIEVRADSEEAAEKAAQDLIEAGNYQFLEKRKPSWDLVDDDIELETDQVEELEPDSDEEESEDETSEED